MSTVLSVFVMLLIKATYFIISVYYGQLSAFGAFDTVGLVSGTFVAGIWAFSITYLSSLRGAFCTA